MLMNIVFNQKTALLLLALRRELKTYRKVERQLKVLIKNLAIFFLFPSKQFLPILFKFSCGKLLPKNRRNNVKKTTII
jgi:hypothetical protein